MSDDDGFDHRLLKSARGYARLYPSILTRIRAAFEMGDASTRELARAMSSAMDRAEGRRELRLRNVYGLSPQEVRVTLLLIDGATVATCAEVLGVAQSTVRSHLKSVFAKTGCRRQSQLPEIFKKSADDPR